MSLLYLTPAFHLILFTCGFTFSIKCTWNIYYAIVAHVRMKLNDVLVVYERIIVVKKSQIGCTFIYLFYTLRAWMSNVSPQRCEWTCKTRFKQNQIFLKALKMFTNARRMSSFNAHELSWDASWPLNFNGTYDNLSSQCNVYFRFGYIILVFFEIDFA